MTIENTKVLIASDESKTLELKKRTGELEAGGEHACNVRVSEYVWWLILGIIPKSMKIIDLEVTDTTSQDGYYLGFDIKDMTSVKGIDPYSFSLRAGKGRKAPYFTTLDNLKSI